MVSFQGKQILVRLPSQQGLMLGIIVLHAMSCMVERGCAGLDTRMACLQVQWSSREIRNG